MNPRILIAGVGNIFFGDDAFGVEVTQRLARRSWPEGVRVVDFGIRGLDLTYALLDSCDVAIIIDASPRGGNPGDLYVIQPDPLGPAESGAPSLTPGDFLIETHGMDPAKVLRLVGAMGSRLKHVLVVACEPAPIDEDEMQMGLSDPVRAAIEPAIALVNSLVNQIRGGAYAPFQNPSSALSNTPI